MKLHRINNKIKYIAVVGAFEIFLTVRMHFDSRVDI